MRRPHPAPISVSLARIDQFKLKGGPTMTLHDLLGIELPIIQAPMAGVQGSALAVAVSNAGGLGSLPCATLGPDAMRRELGAIKAQTDKPFNANFFCHTSPEPGGKREIAWRDTLSPYYREHGIDPDSIPLGSGLTPFGSDAADVLEELKPPVVSFHFGLPSSDLLDRVKATGAIVLCSATNVEEAQWLETQGVDAIIAQGLEAGGHRGNFLSDDLHDHASTLTLLSQILREVNLPVVAAGGIANAKAVADAIALGAAGVQIGTTFLLCPEATTSSAHRTALESDASQHTVVTRIFSGRPARAIANRAARELDPLGAAAPAFPLGFSAIAPLRAKAEKQGSSDFSALWAGQDASGCKEIPAAELTRELAADL
jgi:nitronate monooxygenase